MVVQFCSNDPDDLVEAAKLIQDTCDAIDLNLGCPQHIAKSGNYGAFLCNQRELVVRMVEKAARELKVPIFVKIRRQETVEDTVAYARMLEAAGAWLITVHGRTKEQKGHNQGLADWAAIRAVREAVGVPVFANGNVRTLRDVEECLEYTGCVGVMSACGLLVDPTLFAGGVLSPTKALAAYLECAKEHPPEPKAIKAHTFWMLETMLKGHIDFRCRFAKAHDRDEFEAILAELQERLDKGLPGVTDLSQVEDKSIIPVPKKRKIIDSENE